MLQKLALAVKTKTVEFFADDDEEDYASDENYDVISTDEIITDQRVVVLKPDAPKDSSFPVQTLVSSLFTSVSAFHAAYLQFQTAHHPFSPEAVETADRLAVSHLRRLSELKKACKVGSGVALPSWGEAQVQENQTALRMLEMVFNRMEKDVEEKDGRVRVLQEELRAVEMGNCELERRLEGGEGLAEREFVTARVFAEVVRECCKEAHRFAKVLVGEMRRAGWELDLVANSIHSDVDYAKRGHCGYAVMSYVCLEMFGGFGSYGFGLVEENGDARAVSRGDLLRQFIEHLTVDPVDVLDTMPNSDFAKFCKNKYRKLIHLEMESSLFGKLEWWDSTLRSWQHFSPLYQPFVVMCSAMWMLNKLALAFDRPVEIFQVRQGADFSVVYMENVIRKVGSKVLSGVDERPKVGFTVFPGFRVGGTVFQCKVYLNHFKLPL